MAEDVEHPDGDHQRGVLEQADERVHDPWNRDLERLRQDHQAQRLPVAQTNRLRRLELAVRNRLQTAPDHLRHVGRGERGDHHHHADELIERQARRQEQLQEDDRHEQQRDQRHPAHHLDEADGDKTDHRQFRTPAERQQDADRERQHDAGKSRYQVEHEAAELVRGDAADAEQAADDLALIVVYRQPADQQKGGDHQVGHREPAAVTGVGELVEQHVRHRGNQQDQRDVDPPVGIGGVESVEELIEALVQPRPAGACRGALLTGGAAEVGVEQRPAKERRHDAPQQQQPSHRQEGVQPARKQVGAQPAKHADGRDRGRAARQHVRPAAKERAIDGRLPRLVGLPHRSGRFQRCR